MSWRQRNPTPLTSERMKHGVSRPARGLQLRMTITGTEALLNLGQLQKKKYLFIMTRSPWFFSMKQPPTSINRSEIKSPGRRILKRTVWSNTFPYLAIVLLFIGEFSTTETNIQKETHSNTRVGGALICLFAKIKRISYYSCPTKINPRTGDLLRI